MRTKTSETLVDDGGMGRYVTHVPLNSSDRARKTLVGYHTRVAESNARPPSKCDEVSRRRAFYALGAAFRLPRKIADVVSRKNCPMTPDLPNGFSVGLGAAITADEAGAIRRWKEAVRGE